MGPAHARQQSVATASVYPFASASPGTESPYLPARSGDHDDRRQCRRRELCCDLLLIDNVTSDPSEPATIPGRCLDVSHGGLYATVPLGYGVSIGQRYTLRLMVPERGPEPGAMQVVCQQGIILRTELLVGCDEDGDRLGIAAKLIGHRSGVLPMPAW